MAFDLHSRPLIGGGEIAYHNQLNQEKTASEPGNFDEFVAFLKDRFQGEAFLNRTVAIAGLGLIGQVGSTIGFGLARFSRRGEAATLLLSALSDETITSVAVASSADGVDWSQAGLNLIQGGLIRSALFRVQAGLNHFLGLTKGAVPIRAKIAAFFLIGGVAFAGNSLTQWGRNELLKTGEESFQRRTIYGWLLEAIDFVTMMGMGAGRNCAFAGAGKGGVSLPIHLPVSGKTAPSLDGDPRVIRYKPGQPITPETIIYIDNRADDIHFHHRMARQMYEAGEFRNNRRLQKRVEKGLARGDFQDTTKIYNWIDEINRDLQRAGKKPLRMVVAHAESHIEDIHHQIVTEGRRPAGLLLSGSPKMLTEAEGGDPAVRRTLDLTRYALDQGIPMFGLCFGMHLMAYARYGAMVKYMINPAASAYRVVHSGRRTYRMPAPAGQKQMIWGAENITATRDHPLTRGVGVAPAIQGHAQYIPFPHPQIPSRHVLAISDRSFIPQGGKLRDAKQVDAITELLECGPKAYGTEFHPEITGETAIAMSYVPQFKPLLVDLDFSQVMKDIDGYGRARRRGEQVGRNFMREVLLPDYLERTT